MGAFRRSRMLTKASWKVVKKDKELLFYPIFSVILCVIYFIGMMIGAGLFAVFLGTSNYDNYTWDVFEYVMVFLWYFGTAIIFTFFGVCVSYTAKIRFEGGNAKMSHAIKFAFSRMDKIILWAIVSATVGVIMYMLRQIQNSARKEGNTAAVILAGIMNFIMRMAWTILSLFVVPSIVFYNNSPVKAMKDSAKKFRDTWGENLIRNFGFFLMQLAFFFGIAITGGLIIYLGIRIDSLAVFVGGIVFIVVGIFIIFLIFNILDKIYTTALYIYADTGKIPAVYEQDLIVTGFASREVTTKSKY